MAKPGGGNVASIRPYQTSGGRRWRVRYSTPEGKRTDKRGFKTKAAAESWWGKQAALMNSGDWIDPAHGIVPVAAVAEDWVATLDVRASTMHNIEKNLRLHVLPAWGHVAVRKVSASGVKEWLDSLDLGNGSRRNARATFAQVMDHAVARGLVQSNQVRRVSAPKAEEPVQVFLTPEQVRRLLAEVPANRRVEFMLLVETGLRFGEMSGLHVGDVDVHRRRLRVQRSASLVGSVMVVGKTKSGQSRMVGISKELAGELAAVIDGRGTDEILFPTRNGTYQRRPQERGWFAAALGRVRATDPTFPTLTLHGLRHVAAGLMVRSGGNVKTIQRQLGHKSAAMTLDVYASLFDGDLDGIAGEMGKALWSGQNVGKGEDEGHKNAA